MNPTRHELIVSVQRGDRTSRERLILEREGEKAYLLFPTSENADAPYVRKEIDPARLKTRLDTDGETVFQFQGIILPPPPLTVLP